MLMMWGQGDTKTQKSMAMMSLAPSQKAKLGTVRTGFFGPVAMIRIAVGEIFCGKDLEQIREGDKGGQAKAGNLGFCEAGG